MKNKEEYKDPFKTPDGYFDELYDNIISAKTISSSPPAYLKRWALIGSLGLLVGFGVFMVTRTEEVSEPCVSLACIDEQVLIHEASTIDNSTLIEYIGSENSDTTVTHENLNFEEIDDSILYEEL